MPWKVERKNGRHAVVKKGTGEVVAYHDSPERAASQVRALYANTPDATDTTQPKPKKGKGAKTERLRRAAARRAGNKKKKSINPQGMDQSGNNDHEYS